MSANHPKPLFPREPRVLCAAAVPALLLGMLLSIGGCGSSPTPQDRPAEAPHPDSFATAGNRPPTAQTLYSMGRILAIQGRDRECEAIFKRVIHEHPTFLPVYSALAELQLRTRRIDEAIGTLSAGLRIRPENAVLLNDIGMCHLIKQQNEEALADFTQAVSSSPADARYRANMATVLGLLGRYEEAFALYLQLMPVADAHYNLGVLCDARKDSARAVEEFRQAAQSPNGGEQTAGPVPAVRQPQAPATATPVAERNNPG